MLLPNSLSYHTHTQTIQKHMNMFTLGQLEPPAGLKRYHVFSRTENNLLRCNAKELNNRTESKMQTCVCIVCIVCLLITSLFVCVKCVHVRAVCVFPL